MVINFFKNFNKNKSSTDNFLLKSDYQETYQALLRNLKRREGFGIIFILCSPAQETEIIDYVQKDLPNKSIEILNLNNSINTLYNLIKEKNNQKKIDILFIRGIEKSLLDYKKPNGIGGQGDYYRLDTVPPILSHINLQRERFRDDFKICLVFLVPLYALKYIARRSPDFYDWRSGIFEFVPDQEKVNEESLRYIKEGDYDQYVSWIPQQRREKILEIEDLISELFIKISRIYAADKNWEEAIQSYDKALALKPDDDDSWYNRGNALRELGQFEEAIQSYDKALALKPDYYNAWYNRGIALYKLEQFEEAIQSYDKALALKPDYHNAWYNRGIALYKLGQLKKAIQSYDKALALKPDYHNAWYNRGIALYKLEQFEEAIQSYDKALALKPDEDDAWYNRGIALYKLGQFEEAIQSYDKALALKPDDDDSWYNRGNALRELGQFEEAIQSYDKALALKPDYYNAWYNRGIALYKLEQFEEAIQSYDKALALKPDYHNAWYNRGIALYKLGQLKKAIQSYDKALALKPDYHYAWYNRGNALRELRQFEEAIQSYDKALEFKPEDANTYYNKACCYALQYNIDLALYNLEQAINLDEKYREMAKTNQDFAKIRSDQRFQNLITSV